MLVRTIIQKILLKLYLCTIHYFAIFLKETVLISEVKTAFYLLEHVLFSFQSRMLFLGSFCLVSKQIFCIHCIEFNLEIYQTNVEAVFIYHFEDNLLLIVYNINKLNLLSTNRVLFVFNYLKGSCFQYGRQLHTVPRLHPDSVPKPQL